MGINVRILLLVILFYQFEGSLTQTVHDVVTYTTKSVEELKCNFTSSVVGVQWTEQRDDGSAISLFFYGVVNALVMKQTHDSKYDNFNYSVEGANQFNLLITDVEEDDGGRYLCSPFAQPPMTFDVIVEVLPVSISVICIKSSAETGKAAPHIFCTCAATGVSSNTVDIEWKGTSTPTTSDTTRAMNNATGTFTIRRNITLPSPDWNSSVSCSLTGFQSQIPERLKSYNYTFSPPECTLMHECSLDNKTALLTCNCKGGFTEVNTFWFYDSKKSVIATQSSNIRHVEVEPNTKATFYCSGSNEVDQIVEYELRCQQGTIWWIFIIIGMIGVIAVIGVIAAWKIRSTKVQKTRKGRQTYREEEIELNSSIVGPRKDPKPTGNQGERQGNTSTEARTLGDGEAKLELKESSDRSSEFSFHEAPDRSLLYVICAEESPRLFQNSEESPVDPSSQNAEGSAVDQKVEDSQKESEDFRLLHDQLLSGTEDTSIGMMAF